MSRLKKILPHNLQEPNSRGEDNREERETPYVKKEDGERERYCELIECNMVICFFSWSLIQNHFPHKMHRIDLPCKVLRASALLC